MVARDLTVDQVSAGVAGRQMVVEPVTPLSSGGGPEPHPVSSSASDVPRTNSFRFVLTVTGLSSQVGRSLWSSTGPFKVSISKG